MSECLISTTQLIEIPASDAGIEIVSLSMPSRNSSKAFTLSYSPAAIIPLHWNRSSSYGAAIYHFGYRYNSANIYYGSLVWTQDHHPQIACRYSTLTSITTMNDSYYYINCDEWTANSCKFTIYNNIGNDGCAFDIMICKNTICNVTRYST